MNKMFGLIEIAIGDDCSLNIWEIHNDGRQRDFRVSGYGV